MSRNWAVSARARLLSLAKAQGSVYNQVLVRYALEGILVRLCASQHGARFILKGAMLYILWKPDGPPRFTQDLDLLCFGPPDVQALQALFSEVCEIEPQEPDGLTFDLGSIVAEPIRQEDLYGGVRVTLTSYLDTARIQLQIDVGFGDAPVPQALQYEYPALLRKTKPILRAYAQETAIAEKLHAMVERGLANSRAKDFFDIDYLAKHFAFQGDVLTAAITSTFSRRGRSLPVLPIVAWTKAYFEDPIKLSQWTAFLRKGNLPGQPFEEVVARIESFLSTPLMSAIEGTQWQGVWTPGGPWR